MSGGQERSLWPSRPGVRRRQTLPSLPATPTDDEQAQQASVQQPQPHQRDSWKKRVRHPSAASSLTSTAEAQDPGQSAAATRTTRRLQARLSGDGQPTAHVGYAAISGSVFGDSRGPHRRLGRTPSSPSVLLSKVKERIREKVWKTPCYLFPYFLSRSKTVPQSSDT